MRVQRGRRPSSFLPSSSILVVAREDPERAVVGSYDEPPSSRVSGRALGLGGRGS